MKYEVEFRKLNQDEMEEHGPDRPVNEEDLEMYFRAFVEDVALLLGVDRTSVPRDLCLHMHADKMSQSELMEAVKQVLLRRDSEYLRYFRLKFDDNGVRFRKIT